MYSYEVFKVSKVNAPIYKAWVICNQECESGCTLNRFPSHVKLFLRLVATVK